MQYSFCILLVIEYFRCNAAASRKFVTRPELLSKKLRILSAISMMHRALCIRYSIRSLSISLCMSLKKNRRYSLLYRLFEAFALNWFFSVKSLIIHTRKWCHYIIGSLGQNGNIHLRMRKVRRRSLVEILMFYFKGRNFWKRRSLNVIILKCILREISFNGFSTK